jgi:hypothetical protein
MTANHAPGAINAALKTSAFSIQIKFFRLRARRENFFRESA